MKSLMPPVTYSHDKTTQVPFSVVLLNLNPVEHFPKALLGPDVWQLVCLSLERLLLPPG